MKTAEPIADPEIRTIGEIMKLLSEFDGEVSNRIIWYVTDWNKCRLKKLAEQKQNGAPREKR